MKPMETPDPAPETGGPPAARLTDVGIRFGQTWVLRHATVVIPTGSVVAVVGTNGAGKTSLIRALVGLQAISEGGIEVFGGRFASDNPAHLARVGYVGQRKPLYGYFKVREMLHYGQVTNPRWNQSFAADRIREVGIDSGKRIGQLSGGQRTQVALTMALAKQPDLLVLDEPLADLDPLARQQVLAGLMGDVADRGITVVLSSHVLGELEATCDQIITLHNGQVVLAGDVETIVGEHVLLIGPAGALKQLSRQGVIVDHQRDETSAKALVRLAIDPRFLDPRWQIHQVGMDAVVLGYLRSQEFASAAASGLRVAS